MFLRHEKSDFTQNREKEGEKHCLKHTSIVSHVNKTPKAGRHGSQAQTSGN